jgi:glutathione peroxidase-family protein
LVVEMLTTRFSLPNCGFVGLEILAFPCNQFGGQEPGTNEEIVQFACTRFKAEYPIFDKVDLGS